MKTSRTIRTLLTAALALAPLSAAAAAPVGESALPAAYAAQRDGLRAALEAAKAPHAPAPAPLGISPMDWKEIVAKVRAKGAYSPADGEIPATYGLQDLRGPADAGHVAEYINEWGYTDSKGVFQVGEVSLVSEFWTIPAADGNWHIDQWLFRLDTDGTISSRAHITLVETRDGRVLADDAEQLKDGDPRIKAKYEALLSLWLGFQPRPRASALPARAPANRVTGPAAGFFAFGK
jgi:hypothetical protein